MYFSILAKNFDKSHKKSYNKGIDLNWEESDHELLVYRAHSPSLDYHLYGN